MEVKSKIEEWVSPLLVEQNLFLVDIKVAGNHHVEVFIDGDTGITIGQCAEVSRFLEKHLDGSGLVSENYTLDVSSPGMSNPLKVPRQYKKRIGRILEIVKTDGVALEGELITADDSGIVVREVKAVSKKNKKNVETEEQPKEIDLKYAEIKKALIQLKW